MKYLKLFEEHAAPIINKKSLFRKSQDVGFINPQIEIRIDIKKVSHADDRQIRHVGDGLRIDDSDIIETVELAIEELTLSLMQDRFNIKQDRDNIPTRGVRAGEPNRFVIKNKSNDLNLVCQLEPDGYDNFILTVITVMTKSDFMPYRDQFVIEVES